MKMSADLISPFPEKHLRMAWEWLQAWRINVIDDFSPQCFEQLRDKYRDDLFNGTQSFEIAIDGLPVGMAWFDFLGDGMYSGHLAFEPRSLRFVDTKTTLESVLKTMFSERNARKISWVFFADNRIFHVFLRRLGAVEEGYMRHQTRRDGKLVDVRMMASFKEDFS